MSTQPFEMEAARGDGGRRKAPRNSFRLNVLGRGASLDMPR